MVVQYNNYGKSSIKQNIHNIRCPHTIQRSHHAWYWSYGSWIYKYLCNHCLSLLKLWVRIPFMARCTRYNIMW